VPLSGHSEWQSTAQQAAEDCQKLSLDNPMLAQKISSSFEKSDKVMAGFLAHRAPSQTFFQNVGKSICASKWALSRPLRARRVSFSQSKPPGHT